MNAPVPVMPLLCRQSTRRAPPGFGVVHCRRCGYPTYEHDRAPGACERAAIGIAPDESREPATLDELTPEEVQDLQLVDMHDRTGARINTTFVHSFPGLCRKGLVEPRQQRRRIVVALTPAGCDVVHAMRAR